MTSLFSTKKVLSVLLLIAVIVAAAAFSLMARGNSPIGATSHASVSGDAELADLQFVADAKGVTLEEAIIQHAWRDDFGAAVDSIQNNDPSSIAGAAITSGSSATINFAGLISAYAQDVIDDFETDNPGVTVSTQTNLGYTEEEAEEAVVGAHFAVMEEDGVTDGTTHFDDDANEIVIFVNTSTPPTDEERAELERAAEQGAKDATRPDITDVVSVSLSVVDVELGGYESGSAHMGGEAWDACTSGFGVKVSGTRGITTAAHCADTATDDGHALTFENKHKGRYGDVQWHTGPDAMGNDFYGGIDTVVETNSRQVTSVGKPERGMTLCRNGRVSFRDCQDVRKVNVCFRFTCRLVQMENHFSAGGDSGGPVYWGNTAYGIHTGWMWAWFADREIFTQTRYFGNAIAGMSVATD